MADANMQALQDQVDQKGNEIEVLNEKITGLETQLAERPSEEEVGRLRERITELESEIQTKDVEVTRVQTLAAQGEKALQLAKDTAKRSVLVDMGLSPAEDHSKNYEYTKRCGDIDNMTDISALQSIANSNFGSKTGRKSSIDGYRAPITENGTKKPAMRGANQV